MITFNEQDFLKTYRGTETFVTKDSQYYTPFLELLKDEALLEKIRFANDVLKVPPLKSFILYHRDYLKDEIFNGKLEPRTKRGLGACFGYLYKFIYGGYEAEQVWFDDKQYTKLKSASYFKRTDKES